MTRDPAELSAEKKYLRQKLLFRRQHCVANLDEMAQMVAFRMLPASMAQIFHQKSCAGGYVAWRDEPDIIPLMMRIGATCGLSLPFHTQREAAMEFRRWQDGDTLEKGPWGPDQPLSKAAPAQPDILLCPMLGFDRKGRRLGYGGGNYDRYFADHPATLRIGIAWAVQEVDAVPCNDRDMPLDAILTEQEFIITGDRL
jgi:5-formyltetrahydrofolate cyclo-ligase